MLEASDFLQIHTVKHRNSCVRNVVRTIANSKGVQDCWHMKYSGYRYPEEVIERPAAHEFIQNTFIAITIYTLNTSSRVNNLLI